MNDRSSELKNYNELKFSKEQGFFDKSLGIRWLIAATFAFVLFLTLHFREIRVEVLELSSVAPSYIVAQVDLDFLDEKATTIMKQDAVRDIGKIYLIPDKNIQEMRTEFENFLMYDDEWRHYTQEHTFEEIYKGIDAFEKVLVKVRFTDPRTLRKMRELDFDTSYYQIYTPNSIEETNSLPAHIWDKVKDIAFNKSSLNEKAENFITHFFESKEWNVEEDITTQRKLRHKIEGSIPDRYTHVPAGTRIINQGEKVTARHVAMLQAMKVALGDKSNLWSPLTVTGSLILTLIITVICGAYIYANHPLVLASNRKLFLLVTVIILTIGIAKVAEFFLLSSKSNLIDIVRFPVIVPFSAILICSLMNPSIATFVSGFLAVILMIALAFEGQSFLILNLLASLVAILSTRSLRKRKEIFIVCGKAWFCCVVLIFAQHFYQDTFWNFSVFTDILVSGICMLLIAVLVVGLLPLLESSFRIMTDVTLMEYMDPNNDLLRRLSIEAPGTYQHSVVVGNLAEAAALTIGANGLFCRVATLYHDIGKMVTPQYFTENQLGGMNIHQLLTPKESAHVIIAHVSEGVSMARKAGLPEQFIDIIKEHHGTTLAYYFYRKELEKMGGDKNLVDEKDFRYAGPKPRSKESAIIMIADSIEAASRSLEKITEETLMELAGRLIRDKADDGQFDNCLLTFEELATVKSTLVKTLVAYGHSRIKYPTRETDKKDQKNMVPGNEA